MTLSLRSAALPDSLLERQEIAGESIDTYFALISLPLMQEDETAKVSYIYHRLCVVEGMSSVQHDVSAEKSEIPVAAFEALTVNVTVVLVEVFSLCEQLDLAHERQDQICRFLFRCSDPLISICVGS